LRHRILEDALPVVLATRVDLDLGGDHRHHTDDLRLRKPTEIETIGRPRKVIAHTVEAEVEKVLGFFCRAPALPASRLVGAGDGRQPRNGYDDAVLINGAGLSQLAHPRARHHRGMWRATTAEASVTRARL